MIHHNKQKKPSKQALIAQYLLLFTVAGLPNCTFIEYYKFLNHSYNLAALSEMTLPPYQYVHAFWRTALFLIMTNEKASSTWLPDQEVLRKLRIVNRHGKRYILYELSRAMNNTGLIIWQGGMSKHTSGLIHVARNQKTIKVAGGKKKQFTSIYLAKIEFFLMRSPPKCMCTRVLGIITSLPIDQ